MALGVRRIRQVKMRIHKAWNDKAARGIDDVVRGPVEFRPHISNFIGVKHDYAWIKNLMSFPVPSNYLAVLNECRHCWLRMLAKKCARLRSAQISIVRRAPEPRSWLARLTTSTRLLYSTWLRPDGEEGPCSP